MQIFIFPLLGYLIGSISSAIIISKLMGLPDPRTTGSGNPGATNVLRSGGKKAAAITLLGDFLKGLIPVLLAKQFSADPVVISLTAMAAFFGHLYPVFFKFQGGKGVATALGVFLGLNTTMFIAIAITWMGAAYLTRISSLSALIASAVALLGSVIFWENLPLVGAVFVIVAFIFLKHKDNIERIIAGTESKIGDKK